MLDMASMVSILHLGQSGQCFFLFCSIKQERFYHDPLDLKFSQHPSSGCYIPPSIMYIVRLLLSSNGKSDHYLLLDEESNAQVHNTVLPAAYS